MTNYNNSWNDKEIKKLGRALAFAYKNSDVFGQPLELQSRIDAFRFVLEDDYTVDEVLYGIKLHMKASTEMVKPAHINKMLAPDVVKISTAEFVHAQKQYELGGYNNYSEDKAIIDAFKLQEEDARNAHAEITDARALELMGKFKSKDDSRAVSSPDGYKKLN